MRFPLQCRQIRDSPSPETLPREQSDFDLSLIEPASVSRRVVYREAVPDLIADLLTEQFGQRLAAVDVEIVHNQVNSAGGP